MKKLIALLVVLMVFAGCRSNQVSDVPRVNEAELGKQEFDREDYEKAVDYYDQWLIKYPSDAVVLIERGRANRLLKKYSEALEDLDKAIAINPKDLGPKIYQVNLYVNLNKYKEARAALDVVMNEEFFEKTGVYEKFMAYYMDGQLKNSEENYEKAVLSLEEALKLYELYPHVFRNYKSAGVNRFVIYQRAVAYNGINDYPKAAEDMQKYIDLAKQAGEEVTSKDYMSLALAFYLSDNISKCKAILPNVSEEDRKRMADAIGDSIFLSEK